MRRPLCFCFKWFVDCTTIVEQKIAANYEAIALFFGRWKSWFGFYNEIGDWSCVMGYGCRLENQLWLESCGFLEFDALIIRRSYAKCGFLLMLLTLLWSPSMPGAWLSMIFLKNKRESIDDKLCCYKSFTRLKIIQFSINTMVVSHQVSHLQRQSTSKFLTGPRKISRNYSTWPFLQWSPIQRMYCFQINYNIRLSECGNNEKLHFHMSLEQLHRKAIRLMPLKLAGNGFGFCSARLMNGKKEKCHLNVL